ncbi:MULTISPECIES: putative pilus system protein FilA [Acinetobacter]|uniref:FilA n=1 Tax=Acinetobacter baylyi (strain ATCC 33305 / BD413 / ADP1) TaxID=62977 RepID=Q6Q286_ACIAD|nr:MULTISPECIES: DUF6160 family protein [Acinetobacter]AAS90692.1 FilA [Acinetobacter baylyi] [Acinetobacter baylyi ADP1]ENV55825.1 hypothetical protein F952_00453 [Acinetobacter baylyi DSM 14961 = CIP 107474]KAF2371576.1 protein FilA [Acinetobacter baylyi]KAF2373664.1 protein FilA [Acinetobacter baylyi]KAF2376756.1 protein FilA [Acinetobacter baylyi]
MKIFTKLALVSSMLISVNAMAMQAMDDASMSATTGQDGLNIGIKLDNAGISIGKLYVHDNDGLGTDTNITGATGTAGAIAINGVTVKQTNTSENLLDLKIDTNGSATTSNGAQGAFLNIAATVGAVDIDIGSIGIGSSNTAVNTTTGLRGIKETNPTEILSGLTLSLGKVAANIQLGATPQGAMIVLNSTLQKGLTISNLGINDAAGGGQIYLDNIYVRGADNTTGDLTLNATVGVTANGIVIKNNSAQNINTYIQGVHLGSSTAKSIGDVEVAGLNVGNSTITISGH